MRFPKRADLQYWQWIRFFFSAFGALALILFPLGADKLSFIAMMAIAVAITWFLVGIGVVGILPMPKLWRSQPDSTDEPGVEEEKVGEGGEFMGVSDGTTTVT